MNYIRKVARYLGYAGASFIFIMCLLTTFDVGGRYFFNAPITGTTEISGLMLIIVASFGFGWCALEGKHVAVDILMMHMPKKFQYIMDMIFLFIIFFLYATITVWTAIEAKDNETVSSLLRIPEAPFFWLFTLGWLLFVVSVAVVIIENMRSEVAK